MLRFQGKGELEPLTLNNYFDFSSQSGSYQTTLKMWVYREHLSSTDGNVYLKPDGSIFGREDEILFKHQDIMTLAFWKNSSNFLSVYHFNDE